jgi:hypothetical protein
MPDAKTMGRWGLAVSARRAASQTDAAAELRGIEAHAIGA